MTKNKTPATVADGIETTFPTPAALAAQAGFTNWATVCMAGADSTEMLLTTASGDTDSLLAGSSRAERVLGSYEAVYTTDLNVPAHPKITLIVGANHANHV